MLLTGKYNTKQAPTPAISWSYNFSQLHQLIPLAVALSLP
jgi:hypothetical protein